MTPSSNLLLTGGTGQLGSVVVRDLVKENFSVSVLSSRRTSSVDRQSKIVYGNLVTGEGLKEAVAGQEVIIHLASSFSDHENVDVKGTKNLLENVDESAVKKIIYISIVGVDEISLPYYKSKLKAEQHIQQSGIPCSILRFTQFHDFVLNLLEQFGQNSMNDSFMEIPSGLMFQSIDIKDVSRIILQNLFPTQNQLIATGGPEVLTLKDMAMTFLKNRKINKQLNFFEPEEALLKAFTSGENITTSKYTEGITWLQYLEARYTSLE